MLARHVTRGVKTGLVAGLAFGLLVALVANPLVAFADELGHEGGHATGGQHADHAEGAHAGGGDTGADGADHESPHDGAVSAAVTSAVSAVSGVLWGVLLGGVVFGVAFALLEPAIPGTGAAKSYVLAAAGFVTVSGAPWLVLPPQPPGAEQALPTATRLPLYAGMMVAGALACLLAGALYRELRERRGRVAAAAAASLSLGLLAAPAALAPANGVTHSLPAALSSGLVGLVVFGQAFLWLVLAAAHARLRRPSTDERVSEVATEPSRTRAAAD
ncbi:CbtA family protein [Halosimplex sp. TS25]|uniref:CbtA family protein n=1 Tax=Halosimplex rarum TaxID=3396619 RepID=UPI0039ED4579